MREVSTLADPDQPTKVTQHAFDEARAQSEQFPNMPRAKRILDRLNAKQRGERLSWQGVLVTAHSSRAVQVGTLVNKERIPEQDWLTDNQISFALRFAAIRLKTDTISRDQYVIELKTMKSEGIQVDRLRLPTDHQIVRAMRRKLRERHLSFPLRVKTRAKEPTKPGQTKGITPKSISITDESVWNELLKLAGLRPYYAPQKKVAISSVELLERCYEAHGAIPTRREARTFARANNIPYDQPTQKLGWTDSVVLWKKGREARNLDFPAGPPPRDKRPNYKQNVDAALPGENRQTSWVNIEDCLPHVIAYLEQIPTGLRSTRDDYARWAKQQRAEAAKTKRPLPPSHHAFLQHGGWSKVRAFAQERMNPGPASGSQPETIPATTSTDEKTGRRIPKTKVRAANRPTTAPRKPARSAQTQAKPSKDKEAPADLDPVSRLQRQSFRMPAQPRRRRKR